MRLPCSGSRGFLHATWDILDADMNFDLPIVLAAVAVAGLVAGVVIGYALRSYISHRRRRQRTWGPMTHYPLSPPSKIEAPSLAPHLDDDESCVWAERPPANLR